MPRLVRELEGRLRVELLALVRARCQEQLDAARVAAVGSEDERRGAFRVDGVDAGARAEQRLDAVGRPRQAGAVERRRCVGLVNRRERGLCTEELWHTANVAILAGDVKRRQAVVGRSVGHRARTQKQLHALGVSLLACAVQRRHAAGVGPVHRRAVEQCVILGLEVLEKFGELAVKGCAKDLAAHGKSLA